MALVIGVDPGKFGGIVPMDKRGNPQQAWPMPLIPGPRGGVTNQINWPYLRLLFQSVGRKGKWVVSLEDLANVTSDMPGRGRSMGTQIGEFHLLRDAISASGIPIYLVVSQSWQSTFEIGKNLPRQPPGSLGSMSQKEKQRHSAKRKAIREERMRVWAHAEWPYAADRFEGNWNMGTIAAALIGRHHYEIARMGNG